MCVSLSIKISETERLITPESLEKLRIGCGQVLGYLEMERSQKKLSNWIFKGAGTPASEKK